MAVDLKSILQLHISADRMVATLMIASDAVDEQTMRAITTRREELRAAVEAVMAEQKIVYGIQKDTLNDFYRKPMFHVEMVVARGKEAEIGIDGLAEFHFRDVNGASFEEDEHGRVDYRDLNMIENVEKGDLLYKWTDATIGAPGYTVFGEEIPGVEGKSAQLSAGPGTVIDLEAHTITAEMSGQVTLFENTISVKDVYFVKGDVDLTVGNIFFKGTVHVGGTVREGFRIMADGDVIIDGSVEAASVNANGNITVRNGINGMGTGMLRAGGNISCNYIENSIIKTKGNIRADVILNSDITCRGNLILTGRKGQFMSGHCDMGGVISAKKIGTDNVGDVVIEYKPMENMNFEAEQQFKDAERELQDCQRKLRFYETMKDKIKFTERQTKEYAELLEREMPLIDELAQLRAEVYMERERMSRTYRLLLSVSGTLHRGVKVSVGYLNYFVDSDLEYCHFWLDRGEISHATGTVEISMD